MTADDTEAFTVKLKETPTGRLPPCTAPDGLGYGDVDGDGYVTDADARLIAEYAAGIGTATLTPAQLIRANVKGRDEVNMADANLISQYVAGIRDTFPACSKKEAKGSIYSYSYPTDPVMKGKIFNVGWKIKNIGGTAGKFDVRIIDADTGARVAAVGMGSIAAGAISSQIGQNLTMPGHDYHLRLEVWKA